MFTYIIYIYAMGFFYFVFLYIPTFINNSRGNDLYGAAKESVLYKPGNGSSIKEVNWFQLVSAYMGFFIYLLHSRNTTLL